MRSSWPDRCFFLWDFLFLPERELFKGFSQSRFMNMGIFTKNWEKHMYLHTLNILTFYVYEKGPLCRIWHFFIGPLV